MQKAPYYIRAVIDAHTLAKPDISQATIDELTKDGLIHRIASGALMTTARGQAYVTLLQEVPLPEQKWIDPRQAK